MDIFEKNIDLEFNGNIMTLSLNTFFSILFENIKEEVSSYEEVSYLRKKLDLIEKVLELANNETDYVSINLNFDKQLLQKFSLGLLTREQKIYVIMFYNDKRDKLSIM